MDPSYCYREVALNNLVSEDWVEIEIKSGSQSTLQEIKSVEKSGGYSYKNNDDCKNRNRFIYWRTHADNLEVSEISLDLNLQRNNVRFRFVDSAVISVQFEEHNAHVSMLVATVDCLHRFKFAQDLERGAQPLNVNKIFGNCQIQSNSIFSNVKSINDITGSESISYTAFNFSEISTVQETPKSSACCLKDEETALFAMAYQTAIRLYVMNSSSGKTLFYDLSEGHGLVPRFLANLKDAIVSTKLDVSNYIASLTFDYRGSKTYLLALHHNFTLRIWSVETMQIVASFTQLREYDEQSNHALLLGQTNVLNRISDNLFCAFLSDSKFNEFLIFELFFDTNEKNPWSINICYNIPAPHLTLIDFDVSDSLIWSLWSDSDGNFSVLNFPIQTTEGGEYNWISAALEPPPDRYRVTSEEGIDPREAYSSYVLTSGKFNLNSIVKALNIFRRGHCPIDLKHLTLTALKMNICQAVECELQNEFEGYVINDDLYLEASRRHWERFYMCCEQYHLKTVQPLALVMLPNMNSVCVVRKQSFTLLRPCEIMEHLILVGGRVDLALVSNCYFEGDLERAEDFRQVLILLAEIEKLIPEDFKIDLDKNIYRLENPKDLIAELCVLILQENPDIIELLRNHLKHLIHNRFMAIETLLNILAPEQGQQYDEATFFTEPTKMDVLFASECGLLLLTETVKQTAMMWFAMCRSLLIVQQIIISGEVVKLSTDLVDDLRLKYIPKTTEIFLTNFLRIWIAETPVNLNEQIMSEELRNGSIMLDELPRLKKVEVHNEIVRSISDASGVGIFPAVTLLHMFLRFRGLQSGLALHLQTSGCFDKYAFQDTLLRLNQSVHNLITPTSSKIVFDKWLFGTCQYVLMQDYVRLLSSWCKQNSFMRKYMLATSLLDCEEQEKSLDMLLECAKGLSTDRNLRAHVLGEFHGKESANNAINELCEEKRDLAKYYVHVIQLFDQYGAYDAVIKVAEVAMAVSAGTPVMPMFQSIVFNNHLKLDHFDNAYASMMSNADTSRRSVCLHQLVKTLFDKKRLNLLLKFSYEGIEDDFENIVKARARSEAISGNIVYDFLYSYYIKKDNMTKASTMMFEQAMRLKLESLSTEDNIKRSSSLLAGVNAMHLLLPDYQYIDYCELPKECMSTNDGEEELVVVTIKDFNREWLLSEALYLLSQKGKDLKTLLGTRPTDIVNVLGACKLFTHAIKLAKSFKISLLPTIELLTTICVQSEDQPTKQSLQWLQENDISNFPHFRNQCDFAWALLQRLILENEVEGTTVLRNVVLNKLLTLKVPIPHWLFAQYKRDNYRELLNTLINHAYLLDAADLTKELIDDDLRQRNGEAAPSKLPFLLPINPVDRLMYGLKLCSEDVEHKLMHASLKEHVCKYLDTIKNSRLQ